MLLRWDAEEFARSPDTRANIEAGLGSGRPERHATRQPRVPPGPRLAHGNDRRAERPAFDFSRVRAAACVATDPHTRFRSPRGLSSESLSSLLLASSEARRVVGRAVADTVDPELRVFMKPGHGPQVLPDRPGDPQSSDAGLSPLVGAHPQCAAGASPESVRRASAAAAGRRYARSAQGGSEAGNAETLVAASKRVPRAWGLEFRPP